MELNPPQIYQFNLEIRERISKQRARDSTSYKFILKSRENDKDKLAIYVLKIPSEVKQLSDAEAAKMIMRMCGWQMRLARPGNL